MESSIVVVAVSQRALEGIDSEPPTADSTVPINAPHSEKPSTENVQLILAMLAVGEDANGGAADGQIGRRGDSLKPVRPMFARTALYQSSSPNLVDEARKGELAINTANKDKDPATPDLESDDGSSSEDEFIPRSATPPSSAKLKSSVLNRRLPGNPSPSAPTPSTATSEHQAAATAPPPVSAQSADKRVGGATGGTASPRVRPVAPKQAAQSSAQKGFNKNKPAPSGMLWDRILQAKARASKSVDADPSADAVLSGDKTDGKEASQDEVGQQLHRSGKVDGDEDEGLEVSA
ncbi:hypothetical protein C8Q78DRAFT_1049437 [Trametes maxima]|nr:hypothetical protein C8Q78DRAFT_1049437 [Trametes maxima]